jgi:hypothetical protein
MRCTPDWGTEAGGVTSCTPQKDFKKLGHENAIKHKNRRPLNFLITPCTPLKEFQNDCEE